MNNISGKNQGSLPNLEPSPAGPPVKDKLLNYVYGFLHSKAGPLAAYIVGFIMSAAVVQLTKLGVELTDQQVAEGTVFLTAVIAGLINYIIHLVQNKNAIQIQETLGVKKQDGWLGEKTQERAEKVAEYAAIPKALPVGENGKE